MPRSTISLQSLLLAAMALLLLHPRAIAATKRSAAPIAASAAPSLQSDRIAVSVSGTGPDVLFVPGLASSAHVWDAAVAHLASSHRVHVVQVAGFAGMPAGANASGPVLAPVVAALHDYIAANHLAGIAIVGHSFGGLVALQLAIDHPGDAGRLMIVDALPWLGSMYGARATPALVERQARMLRDQMLGGTQEDYAAAEPAQMAALIGSRGAPAEAAVAAAVASDHRVVAQALYDDFTTDLRASLRRIAIPVTVLYPWDAAGGFPAEMTDALYHQAFAALPSAHVEKVDNSLHFIQLDQPIVFVAKLDAFLNRDGNRR